MRWAPVPSEYRVDLRHPERIHKDTRFAVLVLLVHVALVALALTIFLK
jgi:hypothetical protein